MRILQTTGCNIPGADLMHKFVLAFVLLYLRLILVAGPTLHFISLLLFWGPFKLESIGSILVMQVVPEQLPTAFGTHATKALSSTSDREYALAAFLYRRLPK